jgi:GNAT superfamily N-acetyltransferase
MPRTLTQPAHVQIVAADALDRVARAEIIAALRSRLPRKLARLFEELPGSIHVLARDEHGALVGHAAWVTRWRSRPISRRCVLPTWKPSRTAPAHRRQGLATLVLGHLIDTVTADPAWQLCALSPAQVSLYERAGWGAVARPAGDPSWRCPRAEPAGRAVMIRRLPVLPRPST